MAGSAPHDLMQELIDIGRKAMLKPQQFDPPQIGEPATMILYGRSGTTKPVEITATFNDGQILSVQADTIEAALEEAHHRAAMGP
jgi:hypothetical protein